MYRFSTVLQVRTLQCPYYAMDAIDDQKQIYLKEAPLKPCILQTLNVSFGKFTTRAASLFEAL